MTFSVNGKRLLIAVVTEPIRGAWVADVEVESAADLPASVTIELGTGASFVGTVVRGGVFAGRWVARIVGGAGGLSRDVESRYYDATPARTVLDGIATDSGETLDTAILPTVLGHSLSRWMRPIGFPQYALDDLADELGATWRVTRAGRIWVGVDRWPALSAPAAEITPGPSAGTVSIAPAEAALVRPGVTYLGKRVSLVTTTLQGGKLRQVVWQDEGAGDRLLATLTGLVGRVLGTRLDYLAKYPATVVRQTADGLALDVVPDDDRIKGRGLTRVPIRHGSPGWGVRVPSGTRVSVGFDAGDPRRPYVSDWEPGSVTEVSFAAGTRGANRIGDMVTVPLSPLNIVQLAAALVSTAPGNPLLASPAAIAAAAIPGAPLVPPITIYGCTSSGSAKMKIGG